MMTQSLLIRHGLTNLIDVDGMLYVCAADLLSWYQRFSVARWILAGALLLSWLLLVWLLIRVHRDHPLCGDE